MEYSSLTKRELIELFDNIVNLLNGENIAQTSVNNSPLNQKSDLETLIGSIPFLLQNKKLFETNQDIADFATKLNISVPSYEKKKREDIIGRIIVSIAAFDEKRIKELNIIINSFKKSDIKLDKIKKDKKSFFNEWDAAIKQMKI